MADSSHSADALRKRFEETLRLVLDCVEEFHIENAPDGSDSFMQCFSGDEDGCFHILHSEKNECGEPELFIAPNVPLTVAISLFTSYSLDDDQWRQSVEWDDNIVSSIHPSPIIMLGIAVFVVAIIAFFAIEYLCVE